MGFRAIPHGVPGIHRRLRTSHASPAASAGTGTLGRGNAPDSPNAGLSGICPGHHLPDASQGCLPHVGGVCLRRGPAASAGCQLQLHQFPRSRLWQYFNICSAAEGMSSASALTTAPTTCLLFCFLEMQVIHLYRPSSPSPRHSRGRTREEWMWDCDGARLLGMGKWLGAGLKPCASTCCSSNNAQGPHAPHRTRSPALRSDEVTPFATPHPISSTRTPHARCPNAPCRRDSRCGPGESGDTATAAMEESSLPRAGGQSLREELSLLLPHPPGPRRRSCTKDRYISPCKFAMSAYIM